MSQSKIYRPEEFKAAPVYCLNIKVSPFIFFLLVEATEATGRNKQKNICTKDKRGELFPSFPLFLPPHSYWLEIFYLLRESHFKDLQLTHHRCNLSTEVLPSYFEPGKYSTLFENYAKTLSKVALTLADVCALQVISRAPGISVIRY